MDENLVSTIVSNGTFVYHKTLLAQVKEKESPDHVCVYNRLAVNRTDKFMLNGHRPTIESINYNRKIHTKVTN